MQHFSRQLLWNSFLGAQMTFQGQSRSLETWKGYSLKDITYNFLLVTIISNDYSNYYPILYHLPKSENFSYPIYLKPSPRGFPLKSGNARWVQNQTDRATGPRKKSDDIFGYLDTTYE